MHAGIFAGSRLRSLVRYLGTSDMQNCCFGGSHKQKLKSLAKYLAVHARIFAGSRLRSLIRYLGTSDKQNCCLGGSHEQKLRSLARY